MRRVTKSEQDEKSLKKRKMPLQTFAFPEAECARYADAVVVLETCEIPRERLTWEKAELYEEIAAVKREIREQRKKLEMCAEIQGKTPEIKRIYRKSNRSGGNGAKCGLSDNPVNARNGFADFCKAVPGNSPNAGRIAFVVFSKSVLVVPQTD